MKRKKFTFYFLVKEFFWGTVNALLMITAGAAIASFFIYRYQMPDVKDLSKLKNPQTSIIYDRTGEHVLYEIHGEENRKNLSHEEIPDVVRAVTLAAEDKSFYSHFGIDFLAIFRALKADILSKKAVQGGSTITQQLARNVFLNREKTLARKIKEALLAIKIENNFSKDQILDLYLNEVPYGSNAYGIQKASEIFFGRDAKNLTLDEAAMLAALPKAPTYYSPYGNHTDELKKRQDKIYKKLSEMKVVPQEKIELAKKEDTFSKMIPFREKIEAPHFVFYVIENLEKRYGRDLLETGGLKVITTLDYDMQKIAEKVVAEGAKNNEVRGASNAALVAISPKTGEVLSMVGSRDYFSDSLDGQVNVVLRPRQPGSSFKPIVYATAFENGFQPETLVADAPTNFGPDGSGGNYIPRNYDGKFHGVLPMRKTLAMSLNIPAIKTLSMVGLDKAIDMAHRLGITTINDKNRYGLSLAIGGAEVRPIDLTGAFAVFANDGKKVATHPILEISDKQGNDIKMDSKGEQVIDPQVARKIDSILSDNDARSAIFGPKSPLFIPGRQVAAKTGTTQEFRDAWTVGFTPSIAVGVWAGNNDGRPMKDGSDGVFVAAPIWRSFMDQALPRYTAENFIEYDSRKIKPDLALEDQAKNENKKEDKKSDKKRKKG